jgi:hypothetical protein
MATQPPPESEDLRHRVEESITRLIGLAETLRVIGGNWGNYTDDDSGALQHVLALMVADVRREVDVAGDVEVFLGKLVA